MRICEEFIIERETFKRFELIRNTQKVDRSEMLETLMQSHFELMEIKKERNKK